MCMAVSWNEFRKRHKGIGKEEISSLWKQYKDGAYDIPPLDEQNNESGEVPRNAKEKKVLKNLKSNVSKSNHRLFLFL